MKKLFSFFTLFLIAVSTFSQPTETGTGTTQPIDIEDGRTGIRTERARQEAHYRKEEAACYARFAVTDCLREVRMRRREVLENLRRQEVVLNDAERRRRALEQIEQIKEKSSVQRLDEEAARRREAREVQQEREERANQKVAAAMNAKSGQLAGKSAKTTAEQGRTADDIAKKQKQYRDKLKDAQEHRASREKSNKEKAGTPAKPLPEAL